MKKGTQMTKIKKSIRRIKISSFALTLAAISALAAAQLPKSPGTVLPLLKKTSQNSAFAGPLQTERSFNRLIIKFKQAAATRAGVFDARAAGNHVATLSASTKARNSDATGMSHLKSITPQTHVALTDKNLSRAELFALTKQLEQDPLVEYAEIDELAYPQVTTPTDPAYALQQWHYQSHLAPSSVVGGANLPLAWDKSTGTGVVVAVIDTGYRPHVDLAANLLPGYDFITGATQQTNGGGLGGTGLDFGDYETANQCGPGELAANSSWHGTHVAGTIAAVSNNGIGGAGVAFNAKVLPVRVLGPCGGFSSDIAAGMRWAAGLSVSGVTNNPNKAKVLNMSLGGSGACGVTYQNAVNDVRAAGSVVVVATGNDGIGTISSPANCTGVIAVTAHTKSGDNAGYANVGTGTTLSAPGGGQGAINNAQTGSIYVYSTLNAGTTAPGADSYAGYQGTSMATPHVAGVAALLASLQPTISPDTLASVLTNSVRAHPAGTYCALNPLVNCGAGLLDANAAIDRLNTLSPTVSASHGAGVEQTGATIHLTSYTTVSGGNSIASYHWTQLSGPSVTLAGSTTSSASFVAPSVGNVFSFKLEVTDTAGLAASGQVGLTSNTAPVLAPITSPSVVQGQSLSFTASATDVESNPIVYVPTGLPSGSSLNSATGVFTWNNAGPVGNYSFTITPNDGMVNGTPQTVSVSVTASGSAVASAGGGGGGGGAMSAWELLGLAVLLAVSVTTARRRAAKQ
ncbi:MAG: S8 family serine peptidase [Pseudomonadota bacterium]